MTLIDKLRKINRLKMCKEINISYNIIRHYLAGNTKELSQENESKINEYLKKLSE